jgi:hypothetical protein
MFPSADLSCAPLPGFPGATLPRRHYTLRMTTAEEMHFNARSHPLGYHTSIIGGQYFMHRLDNPTRQRVFCERAHYEAFLDALEKSPSWRLDLEHGDVDVDRATGIVTPRDGRKPFSVHDAQGWTGVRTRPTDDMARHAHFLHIYRQDRPPYGGAWHKSAGF